MTALRTAAQQALEALEYEADRNNDDAYKKERDALRAALDPPERTLTDEVIATLWHQNGGFHHHFARAIERWLRGHA